MTTTKLKLLILSNKIIKDDLTICHQNVETNNDEVNFKREQNPILTHKFKGPYINIKWACYHLVRQIIYYFNEFPQKKYFRVT